MLDHLLAVLGPGLLGGALAYFAWSRLDPSQRTAVQAAPRLREDPPVTLRDPRDEAAQTRGTATAAAAPLVFRSAEPAPLQPEPGPKSAADRPVGASAGALAQTAHSQAEGGVIDALREDLSELATSLLTIHETLAGHSAQAAKEDPALGEIAARLDELAQALEAALAPDQLAEALVPHLPGAAAQDPALAALPARVEHLASALTAALGGLPGELRRAVAEHRPQPPDLSRIEEDLSRLIARDQPGGEDIAAAIGGLGAELAALAERIGAQDSAVPDAALGGQLAEIAGRLAAVEAAVAPGELDTRLARIGDSLSAALEDRLGAAVPAALGGQFAEIAGRLAAVEAAVGAAAAPDGLESRLARIEETLAAATATEAAMSALEDRLDAAARARDAAWAERLAETLARPSAPDGDGEARIGRMERAVGLLEHRLGALARLDDRLRVLETSVIEEIRDLSLLARESFGPSGLAALSAYPDAVATDPAGSGGDPAEAGPEPAPDAPPRSSDEENGDDAVPPLPEREAEWKSAP